MSDYDYTVTQDHIDRLGDEQDAREKAEAFAAREFTLACQQRNVKAICEFAPLTTDWATPLVNGKRQQTLTECMEDSLGYGEGPAIADVMQLLVDVAYGADLVNRPAAARALIKRMADTWAAFNVEVDE